MSQRKRLILDEKRQILEYLIKGQTVTELSKRYGVAKSTICGIKNKKKLILNKLGSNCVGAGKTKTLRKSNYAKMEKALYKWFAKMRERNVPVNGLMLQKKAKKLQTLINEKSLFNASNGWLNRFKKRYGIRLLKITGEKLSSQVELVDPFKEKLQSTIEELELTPDQIYNADESGLYWKFLPDKTFVTNADKTALGRKTIKQRITFMACTNASGNHKLKPLVIGKSKKPPAFRNFHCPVHYRHSKTAWMTTTIFKEWFQEMFVPEVTQFLQSRNLPIKALLLLDNALSYPPEAELKSSDGLISVLYMPPNVTPLIKPMDQNAIRITKLFYQKYLLTQLLAKDADFNVTLKAYSLRDAVSNLAMAWGSLKQTVIEKCWHSILGGHFDNDEENIPLSVLRSRLLLNDEACNASKSVVNLLQHINTDLELQQTDVEDWNQDNKYFTQNEILIDSDPEKEDKDEMVPYTFNDKLISINQALTSLNEVIQWSEENEEEVEISTLLNLHSLRQKVLTIKLNKK